MYLQNLLAQYQQQQQPAQTDDGRIAPMVQQQPDLAPKVNTEQSQMKDWVNKFSGDLAPIRAQQYEQTTQDNTDKGFLGKLSPQDRFLLDLGLGMMMSASKPGATFAGALGEGGKYAADSDKSRADYLNTRSDKVNENKSQFFDKLGDDYGNTKTREMESDKFGLLKDQFAHTKNQDSVQNMLSQNELRLRELGLNLDQDKLRYEMTKPDASVQQDKDGGYYSVDKNTGKAMPITGSDGKQIVGTAENAQTELMQKIIGNIVENHDPYDSISMEEKVQNAVQTIGKANLGGGGFGKDSVPPPPPPPPLPAGANTRTINGKTYIKQDGKWYEQ